MNVQNPVIGKQTENSAANHAVVREVTGDRSMPVLDVNKALTEAGDLADLFKDDVHSNPGRSRVWT